MQSCQPQHVCSCHDDIPASILLLMCIGLHGVHTNQAARPPHLDLPPLPRSALGPAPPPRMGAPHAPPGTPALRSPGAEPICCPPEGPALPLPLAGRAPHGPANCVCIWADLYQCSACTHTPHHESRWARCAFERTIIKAI